jgi:hypothetical protein
MTTRRGLWLGGLLVALLHGGCKTAPPPPPPSGQLFLELTPPQASVLVDDRPLLRRGMGALRVSLPAGAHRVEVYAPGYFHAYRDIAITAATESRLQVALRPDPDVLP